MDDSLWKSIAEGWDVALRAEPSKTSLRKYPQCRPWGPQPKMDAIRYRAPKPFVRTLPQNPPSEVPQRQLFFVEADLAAEEVLLDSD